MPSASRRLSITSRTSTLLRVPQRTHLPATGFMASGAIPGRLRAEGASDRCRGAPVLSPRPAGRLRPASFSSSAHC
eukprot:7077582-Prymnesium_polylepis.1